MADALRLARQGLLGTTDLDGDADVVREGVRVRAQAVMDREVSQHVGAGRHEGSPERTGQRTGSGTGVGHARGDHEP